ncbi:MAG: hypothetical protein U5L76_01540 [Patescibacteria group bacterium]|nr:hypothetical protein [Patescibacteria group bacterium]
MRRFISLLMVGLLSFTMMASISCERSETSVEAKSDKERKKVSIHYVGNESHEDVLASIRKTEKLTGHTFSDEQKTKMLQDFRDFQSKNNPQSSKLATSVITAYTCYYVYNGDKDLKLEFKWWAGHPRSYYFTTPNWTLYWLIKVCYGGNILSWTWMEGGYQRVSAIVGSCVYLPLGSSFVRSYLWLVYY